MPLARDTGAQLHALTGRGGLFDLVAAFKSFYRFAPIRHPLLVHDDGSLHDRDIAFLSRHLPGVVVIRKEQADRRVTALLRAARLERCIELRARLVFALKLLDLRVYAEGQRALYMDSDVLFHRPPVLLLELLAGATRPWVDRYNEDIASRYTWSEDQILTATGVAVKPHFNAGLFCVHRPQYDADFHRFEACLAIPAESDALYYAEQTLNAIDVSAHDGEPLPAYYDVCFRHTYRDEYYAWLRNAIGGEHVTSQHYCGGSFQRRHFYRHFIAHVAPALRD